MEENGGYATLGHLYKEAFNVKGCAWNTKTPFASIRRIVQDERFFFRIKPGLWGLNSYKKKLPATVLPEKGTPKEEQIYNHSYYQGLLVEVGNLKGYETFVPYQDKHKPFLNKKLNEIATLDRFHEFTYRHILDRARTVDVTWFNQRKMPHRVFEVEHSTDMNNSLLKFVELQDFQLKFFIVADERRKPEFLNKRGMTAFAPISGRIDFMSYEELSRLHQRAYEYSILNKGLDL